MNATSTEESQVSANGQIVVANDVHRRYGEGEAAVDALAGVSTAFDRGRFAAIMGPSGSGKSTLMNLIGCLDSPTGGEYWLNGHRVSELDDDALARIRNKEIGFVFQTFNLLPRASSLDNVALPLIYAGYSKSQREEKAMDALRSVGLGERAKHKPNELSGGQRQRVAIARALVNDPSIILADEPTGNLDSMTSDQVMTLLAALARQGKTVVAVTHERDLGRFFDRTVSLRDGRIESDSRRASAIA